FGAPGDCTKVVPPPLAEKSPLVRFTATQRSAPPAVRAKPETSCPVTVKTPRKLAAPSVESSTRSSAPFARSQTVAGSEGETPSRLTGGFPASAIGSGVQVRPPSSDRWIVELEPERFALR